MKIKLFVIFAFIALCSAVFAQEMIQPGEKSYLHYKTKMDSIHAFHAAQKLESEKQIISLAGWSHVKGKVYESNGVTPIANAAVAIWDANYGTGWYFYTDQNGNFSGNAYLSTESFYAQATGYITGSGNEYDEEYYNESPTKGGATLVAIGANDTTTGINFTLIKRGAISGRILEEDGVTPIPYAWTDVYNLQGEQIGGGSSDANGYYTAYGICSGEYYVAASGYIPGGSDAYITEYYNNKTDLVSADKVNVSAPGTVSGVDFSLARGGYFLNTVTEPYWAGTVKRTPEKSKYAEGDVVTLSIDFMYPGYKLDQWTGDVSSTDSIVQITIDGDKDVTAYLIPVTSQGYTMSTSVYPADGGSINRDPDKEYYDFEENVTVTAVPVSGWVFDHWSNAVDGNTNPETVVMNGDKYLQADFGHSLNITVYPLNSGSVTRSIEKAVYTHNEELLLTAVAGDGFQFKRWNGDISSTQNPASITFNSNKYVYAMFEPVYELTIQITPEGGGLTSPAAGSHAYVSGSVVEIVARPADGHHLKEWQGDVAVLNDSTAKITMNKHETVTAVFEADQTDGVNLTLQVYPENSGATEPGIGTHSYNVGETVEISAVASNHYRFKNWTGGAADPNSSSTTVTLVSSMTVQANFEKIYYSLTLDTDPQGSGTTSPAPGTHYYQSGQTVAITATPLTGYKFINWTGEVAETDSANTTVTMNNNRSIKANFEKIVYILTLDMEPEGWGEINPGPGEYTFEAGDVVEISAAPFTGYDFKEWSGGVVDPDSAVTTAIMDSSLQITAHFAAVIVVDDDSPILKNCFPSPNANAVPKNSKIKFRILDEGMGVNIFTLNTWVDNMQILQNGYDLTGGLVSLLPCGHGYKVTYQPENPFEEGAEVTVHVTCDDLSLLPNHCDETFTFSVGTTTIESVSANILSQIGGTVGSLDAGVEIHVPASALNDSLELSINKVDNLPPLPEGITGIATPYHFGPDGLKFNIPVVIGFAYTEATLLSSGLTDPMDLSLYYYHTLSGEWSQLTIDSVDTINRILYTTVEEFCYFTFSSEGSTTFVDPIETRSNQPDHFGLSNNYPNPFNPETHIRYQIPDASQVVLDIYDTKGRFICSLVNEKQAAGTYEITWNVHENNRQVSTGIYLLKLQACNQTSVMKVSYIK